MTIRHPPIVESLHRTWQDEEDTARYAEQFIAALSGSSNHAGPLLPNLVLELEGDLGAGKTTFTRHLLRAMGVHGAIKSPTYTVVETYDTLQGPVAHFDFYRFNDPQEWEDAGFRDIYAGDGLKIAEWPSQARDCLPLPDLRLQIQVGPAQTRQVCMDAYTPAGQAVLEKWPR